MTDDVSDMLKEAERLEQEAKHIRKRAKKIEAQDSVLTDDDFPLPWKVVPMWDSASEAKIVDGNDDTVVELSVNDLPLETNAVRVALLICERVNKRYHRNFNPLSEEDRTEYLAVNIESVEKEKKKKASRRKKDFDVEDDGEEDHGEYDDEDFDRNLDNLLF